MDQANGRIDFHFCTVRLNEEGNYEHSWHCMPYNSDFSTMLRKYGRLPVDSIEKQMDTASNLSLLDIEHKELEDLMKKDVVARA